MPLLLGVTGSIAAGKSLLCTHLAEAHGALHVDADREVHRMYAPDTPGFERVVSEFGEEIVGEDGVIDRRVLGGMVFGKPERMEALRTAIGDIPAYFMALLDRWREELPEDGIAVLEAVNLLENAYMTKADAAWLVVTQDETAVTRLMETRSLSREEAEQRLASARDWRERAPAADRIFHNNGTEEAYLAAVDEAIAETVSAFRAGTLPRPRWYEAQGSER
ncbi:MAG: dephospho-CoA kinase [Chloroflexi bacterium]|nr:dephospho-CoA kinase [Chloroflexota bacterium]